MRYQRIEEADFIREIERDIEDGTCFDRPLVNVNCYASGGIETIFYMPKDIEELVNLLFVLSLSSNIVCVERVIISGKVFAYELHCDESNDGTTNIDDELIGRLYKAFRRENCK